MSLVGIISDTHGKLPLDAYGALADCDHIIHAGDICGPEILDSLRTLAPLTAVLGNNDYPEYGSDVGLFANVELFGVRFLVAHYPQDVRIGSHGTRALAPGDPLPQVCVHGHTHSAYIATGPDVSPAQVMLCPGAIARPRGGYPATVAKVLIEDAQIQDVWVEAVHDGARLISW